MKKTRIIIGNWKMNPVNSKDAEKLFKNIAKSIYSTKRTDVVVCSPFLYIEKLKKISKRVLLGAQDAFGEETGAYTGELSGAMLYNVGARYVILGHSERRALGEDNKDVNKKIKGALSAGLVPVLCVGESMRDENHGYFSLVKTQLEGCLAGISKNLIFKIIIAYEPVWAISTTLGRKDATSRDCEEMVIFIKKVLADKFGLKTKLPKIIYGGSANEKDAADFLQNGGVDGLLVGRASLDAKKFAEIIRISESL